VSRGKIYVEVEFDVVEIGAVVPAIRSAKLVSSESTRVDSEETVVETGYLSVSNERATE